MRYRITATWWNIDEEGYEGPVYQIYVKDLDQTTLVDDLRSIPGVETVLSDEDCYLKVFPYMNCHPIAEIVKLIDVRVFFLERK